MRMIWFALVPFGRQTARGFSAARLKELRRQSHNEAFEDWDWFARLIALATGNLMISIIYAFFFFSLFWHIYFSPVELSSCYKASFLGFSEAKICDVIKTVIDFFAAQNGHCDTCSGSRDVSFLIATVIGSLIGIVVPILTAFNDLADKNLKGRNRQYLYQIGRLRTLFVSSLFLLIVALSAEAFGRVTTSIYFGQVSLFVLNLLLFARLFFVIFYRTEKSDIALSKKRFADDLGVRLSQIGVANIGDRSDD